VEHSFFRLVCLFILFVSIQGCRQEDANPELSDPIYLDLVKELNTLKSTKEDIEKKIIAAEKELSKSAPRTIDRKNAENELKRQLTQLGVIDQQHEYYKIRTERRRVEGRRSYRIAFEKKEEWPDPKEFDAYKTNKKLYYASKNWNERVPKTNHNQKQYDLPPEKGDESENGQPPSGH